MGLAYLAITVLLSRKKRRVFTRGPEPKMVVFVVPALNEAAVIANTVNSLAATTADWIIVVDDGSDDGTAEVVEALGHSHVDVYTRTLPEARQGKGRALNDVYRHIRRTTTAYEPDEVVIGIIDADGRVSPDVIQHVKPYFQDQRIGALQILVRIRNRAESWLVRFQDYEFLVFSSLTQTAREHVNSVGLGGNGQFTRLSALVSLGDDPWTDCLTEDLDLGVRLAIGGWKNRFCGETAVGQEGVSDVPRLVRQRTRWAQGHFQCWSLIPRLWLSPLPSLTVLDITYYLLAPGAVLVASMVFTGTFLWTIYQTVLNPGFWLTPFGLVWGIVLYTLSFGPALGLSFVYRRRSREMSRWGAVGFAHMLAVYNYLWYLAEWKALARIITRRGSWSKTAREAV